MAWYDGFLSGFRLALKPFVPVRALDSILPKEQTNFLVAAEPIKSYSIEELPNHISQNISSKIVEFEKNLQESNKSLDSKDIELKKNSLRASIAIREAQLKLDKAYPLRSPSFDEKSTNGEVKIAGFKQKKISEEDLKKDKETLKDLRIIEIKAQNLSEEKLEKQLKAADTEVAELNEKKVDFFRVSNRSEEEKRAYVKNEELLENANIESLAFKAVIDERKLSLQNGIEEWVDGLVKKATKSLLEEERLIKKTEVLKEAARGLAKEELNIVVKAYYNSCKDLQSYYEKQAKAYDQDSKDFRDTQIKYHDITCTIHKDQAFEWLKSGDVKFYDNNILLANHAAHAANKFRLNNHIESGDKTEFKPKKYQPKNDRADHFFSAEELRKQDNILKPPAVASKEKSFAWRMREGFVAGVKDFCQDVAKYQKAERKQNSWYNDR